MHTHVHMHVHMHVHVRAAAKSVWAPFVSEPAKPTCWTCLAACSGETHPPGLEVSSWASAGGWQMRDHKRRDPRGRPTNAQAQAGYTSR